MAGQAGRGWAAGNTLTQAQGCHLGGERDTASPSGHPPIVMMGHGTVKPG